MKSKVFPCLLVIFSIWTSLFAPFISAQNSEKSGLQFRVSEADAKPTQETEKPPIKIENLSGQEADAIFRRLPQMPVETLETADFKMSSDSLKPPKAGEIIPLKFPADENQKLPDLPETTNETLKVERFSPSDSASLVTDLSVTFSQPMIAISSQNEVNKNVPVILTPEIKGNWRWLGANTLTFDAETRFPMATKFAATIPKGTKSVIGGILEKDVSWTFETPPPLVEKFAPNAETDETLPKDITMAVKFNQEIDETEILPKIKVFVNGKQFEIKSATDETPANNNFRERLGEVKPNYWLAFRTFELLPLNANVKVVFEKNLPSAEGNLASKKEQSFTFKTLTPFKLLEKSCGYNQKPEECEPSGDFSLKFNRSFSAEFDKSLIKIEPAIEDFKIENYRDNSEIYIKGYKKPNTTYKVTVSGKASDLFKQTLGEDVTATFKVGKSQPIFHGEGEEFMTLDPNGKLRYSINSRNHKSFNVRLYSVTPKDYVVFRNTLRLFNSRKKFVPKIGFGKLISDKNFEMKTEDDNYEETSIDLAKAIPNKYGHAVLVAEPTVKTDENYYFNKPFIIWIQSTNIGLDAFLDYEKLIAFATDLKTAKPLSNAEISLHNGNSSVINSSTNQTGIAEFELTNATERGFLVAEKGEDSAILRENDDYDETVTNWRKEKASDDLRWFVFDDRKIYRPEEQVSIKGYIRKVTDGKLTDIAELDGEIKNVRYVLKDSRNNEIGKGYAKLNAFGAFDFKLDLQKNINLGYQNLEFWTNDKKEGAEFEHNFQVQEFRRPEFEVSAKVESNAPFFIGESATVSAKANYYSGGFLKNAEISWNVTSTPTNYTPPNRDDFTFGKFVPWWRYSDGDYDQRTSKKFSGKTDEDGKHFIKLDFDEANPARPYTIRAEANVQDVNRQAFASAANLLVHPANLYVGIRSPKNFVRPNEKLKIETITTDLDGKAIAGKTVSIVAELKDYKYVGGDWTEVLIDKQTCKILSTEDVASCLISAKEGGVFNIKATVLDDRERKNESELTVWVAGGNSEVSDEIAEEDVEMIPDKKEYFANDTAEVLINSPFFPAEGVMTLQRNGIVKTERFSMNENSKILKIPIEENYLPNIHVKVDLVGTTPRKVYQDERDAKLPQRPAYASGELNLSISTKTRKLNVTAETIEKTLEPGGETKIKVAVQDVMGNAVANSEVAVVAVDESVLALTNYVIQNPLDAFYKEISANVTNYHSRENILLSYPDDIGRGVGYGSGSGNGSGSGGGGGRGNDSMFRRLETVTSLNRPLSVKYDSPDQIKIRRNFDALAIFSPNVLTDENGKATVDLKLPDNLTRYRITAIAATKSKQFGKSESNFTAKTSLQVRPSAPRFMNFGDTAELPVVLQNQTDSPMMVDVAIRTQNANLPNGNGKKVTIPANDRAEIRFDVSTESAGIARFQVGAVSGKFADAAEFAFPVYTPATSEAFATYGTTEKNGAIVQSISAPENVYPQFGGLEIMTSSTQLQELTDAFIYLQNYPFECSEQISSRVLSVAALRDVLTAFDAKDLPSKEEIEAKMKADIERLKTLQHSDGGFSFWRSDDESIPYVSVHVAHAIARAKAKGYDVSDSVIVKSTDYLRNIEAKYPKEYSEKSRWAISAYALYVRDLLGENDSTKVKKLLNEVNLEKLSLETDGWLLSVLANDKNSVNEVEKIKTHLLNRVTETAGNAHFVTNYSDGEYVLLSSERRADGVILEALLKVQSPESEVQSQELESLIPKIVRGLLANRIKGRWSNTQENAFILLALDKYFQTYEKVTPNFVAKVWLEKAFAGEQKFVGRSVDSNLVNVPMRYLQNRKESKQNLVLDKQGEGRLYYRIGLKYATKNLNVSSADYGFEVSRTYEALDSADDVKQNADGSWIFKAGARIRINIQMVAPTRRYHVALVDNLPAGIEIVNSGLANSSKTYLNYSDELRKRSFWFNHQNLRDNRAEVFTTFLREGVWNYSYSARATTPGIYIVPPAKAEEMYSPETFGRSNTDFVRIE